jgi:predicted membrane channel-forming protein YqfA (hemolysin III family)
MEKVLQLITALIPLIIIGCFLYLFITTLIRATKLHGSDQIVWVLIIIFLFPLGSIIFLFAKPDRKQGSHGS